MLDKTKFGWWKSAVFYQIYPKSFLDANGDGIGDIRGIIQKLGYLEKLGVDGIWLSPVCASPQVDNGYDISDYQAIWPTFGTMEDMEQLIREAKERGISIIMDLVLNHTSDQHRWFQEALKDRENPYHDYYVWRDGTPDAPPNDMQAVFGGSMWTYVPHLRQYYFHQFAVQQPDLNWENPVLRRELYDMIRFWVDKGVEGFRLDVIDQIAKDPDRKITGNGPRLHEFLEELSREAFIEEGLVTVGEAWGADVERARKYSAQDGRELSMVFQFEHICLDQKPGGEKWDWIPLPLVRLKRCVERWQQGLHGQGWNSLFMNNHDLPRVVSRWGDDGEYRVESAKMLATMLYGLEGTPYIYQGEELGMTNVRYEIGEYRDIETLNLYQERLEKGYEKEEIMRSIHAKSRDNARTPMQWNDGENAGFTAGEPWIRTNPNYREINAAKQTEDEDSVFRCYQELIRFRKEYPVFAEGEFRMLLETDEDIFAYTRTDGDSQLLVICNFHDRTVKCPLETPEPDGKLLIGNYRDRAGGPDGTLLLRPYEARMYLTAAPKA